MAVRKIVCPKCGEMRPTPHDDAAQGLYERRTHGTSSRYLQCDYCGKELDPGDAAIALTIPQDYPIWETEYLNVPTAEGAQPSPTELEG